MFYRRCSNEQPHEAHTYWYEWHKEQLPFLPPIEKEKLPDKWKVQYKCKGVQPW